MNRPCFKDFRTQVAAYAQSVGSPLGICVNNIPSLVGLVNISTEQLINDPNAPDEGWWGGWAKMLMNITPNLRFTTITLPRGVARVIVMDVCQRPTKVQNGYYEFLDFGEGLQPKLCGPNTTTTCNGFTQTYDRDTTPVLGVQNTNPQFIRVFPTDSRDVGKSVIVQGKDQNGNVILATDPVSLQPILGEILTLTLPFVQSVNQFANPLTGIEKDSTYGPITIMQVDPVSGTAAALSSMEPSETSAAYRQYLINNLPCNCCANAQATVQVTVMAKLEYVPIASDPDYLLIPNVPALIAQCESIRYSAMDNVKALAMADKKHTDALRLLFGQLDHVLGKERPAITVPLFGTRRRLRHQPI